MENGNFFIKGKNVFLFFLLLEGEVELLFMYK